MAYGRSRNSTRLKQAERMRIIDESTRNRRIRQLHETLEADNHHEDPVGDLVTHKKLPKFEEELAPPTRRSAKKGKKRKKKGLSLKYAQSKYRNTHHHFVIADAKEAIQQDRPSWLEIAAPTSKILPCQLCAVCGYPSCYSCITCGVRVCHTKCFEMHFDTRCIKWM